MSLQVWLPLNGDLHNQGIQKYNLSTIGTVSWPETGKIGKCFQGGSGTQVTNGISIDSNLTDILNADYSIAVWIKPLGNHVHYNGTVISSGNWNAKRWAFGVSQDNTKVDVLSNGHNVYINCQVPINTWTHLVCIRQSGVIKLYKNGVYVNSLTGTSASATLQSDATNTTIGRQTYANGYFSFNGCINDLRIYNNALSEKQIKEISKGLILHYPLNRNGWKVASNLLLNGFGDLGTINWDVPSRIYIDDLPINNSSIQARFVGLTSLNYIPIYRNHTYKYSCYIKALVTSGNCYPSLFPYDRDKNFIAVQNTKEGFNLNTMTTIAQQLNPGDTKIYVTSLANWNANSGTYYNYAAIFKYKDSTGYEYPEGTYTRNIPAFGSGTNAKTNLDKINNIITLNSAYNGPVISVGTKICAATAGSTYFYPLGGIACNTIQDWTYKENTFSSEHPRLIAAKYVKVYTYTNSSQAGIKLEDLTINDNIQYDISGYQNNGTKYNIIFEEDTPKYSVSSVFTSANTSYIKVSDNKWMPQYQEAMTINVWAYSSNWASTTKLFSCTETGGWNTEAGSSGYIRFPIYVATNEAQTSYAYKYSSKELKISDLSAGWHMLTFIYDSTGNKVYLDGQLHSSYAFTSYGIKYNTNARLFLGCEASTASPTSPYFNGKLSDFRIYATVLSAQDILSLYNNGAYIDQSNVIHGQVR